MMSFILPRLCNVSSITATAARYVCRVRTVKPYVRSTTTHSGFDGFVTVHGGQDPAILGQILGAFSQVARAVWVLSAA